MDAPFGKVCGDECFGIYHFMEAESTNDLAHKTIYKHKDIIIADSQISGRGQGTNSWLSEPGKNLTFSMVLEPQNLPASRQFLLSKIISLAITDMLESYRIKASIKWPNDIYIGDKKVAGILIENEILGTKVARVVIGIGLNVNQKEFDEGLPNPISMTIAANREFELEKVLTRFCNCFSVRCEQLYAGETEQVDSDYFSRLYLANTAHRFTLPDGKEFVGTIRSVSGNGELKVETKNGQERTFLFKEIIF